MKQTMRWVCIILSVQGYAYINDVYIAGEEFKDKIIPHAVDYFTGKALEYEDFEGDDDFEVNTNVACINSTMMRLTFGHLLLRMTFMMKKMKMMKKI